MPGFGHTYQSQYIIALVTQHQCEGCYYWLSMPTNVVSDDNGL